MRWWDGWILSKCYDVICNYSICFQRRVPLEQDWLPTGCNTLDILDNIWCFKEKYRLYSDKIEKAVATSIWLKTIQMQEAFQHFIWYHNKSTLVDLPKEVVDFFHSRKKYNRKIYILSTSTLLIMVVIISLYRTYIYASWAT